MITALEYVVEFLKIWRDLFLGVMDFDALPDVLGMFVSGEWRE